MNTKLGILLCTACVVAASLVGCDADEEQQRTVVSVYSLNDNQAYQSDIVTGGVYMEDVIPVVFQSRAYNSQIVTGTGLPYNDFLITGYRIEYIGSDGSTYLPPYVGAMNASIEIDKQAMASVILVPALYKSQPPLSGLGGGAVLCTAHYTFMGREVGSGREQEFKAAITVNFADWADS